MVGSLAKKEFSRAQALAFCALSIALMAVSAWVTVPLGPVPFTLQVLAILFVLFALPPKLAFAAITGYVVLGALGLPIFSSFKGGLSAILGPTGGFIVGYVIAGALAIGVAKLVERIPLFGSQSMRKFFGIQIATGVLAHNILMGIVFLLVLYVFGWAWLMISANMTPAAAFASAVAPFVVVDLLKMVGAVLLAQAVDVALLASARATAK